MLQDSNRGAIEVAFIIESGFLDKLCIISVRLRLWRPRVQLRDEWSLTEFGEIDEKNGARVRRHQRK